VCNEERHRAFPIFEPACSDSNIDPSPRNVSSIAGGREQEMRSASERDVSKADGTILNEKSVTTTISATYTENQQSLISKDDQTSSKRTTTSAQVVFQRASCNSVIEENESAPGFSASEECADLASNPVKEEKKSTFVIPEEKWRTLPPIEVIANRNEAQCSRQDNVKIYPINKQCFKVKEKVGMNSTGSEFSISPVAMGSITQKSSKVVITLEAMSGITIPIQVPSSTKTGNETNCPANFSRERTTSIVIQPNENHQFSSEMARMQEKDKLIKQLLRQNERRNAPEVRLRGKWSPPNLQCPNSSNTTLSDESKHDLKKLSTSDLLHEKLRNLRDSINKPGFKPEWHSEGSVRKDTGDSPLAPLKFRSPGESRERRWNSDNLDHMRESSSYFGLTLPVTL